MLTDDEIKLAENVAVGLRSITLTSGGQYKACGHILSMAAELRDIRMIVGDAVGTSETLAAVRRRTLEEVLELVVSLTHVDKHWVFHPEDAIRKLLKETT